MDTLCLSFPVGPLFQSDHLAITWRTNFQCACPCVLYLHRLDVLFKGVGLHMVSRGRGRNWSMPQPKAVEDLLDKSSSGHCCLCPACCMVTAYSQDSYQSETQISLPKGSSYDKRTTTTRLPATKVRFTKSSHLRWCDRCPLVAHKRSGKVSLARLAIVEVCTLVSIFNMHMRILDTTDTIAYKHCSF